MLYNGFKTRTEVILVKKLWIWGASIIAIVIVVGIVMAVFVSQKPSKQVTHSKFVNHPDTYIIFTWVWWQCQFREVPGATS